MSTVAAERVVAETPAERGLRLLTTKPYLTPDFDDEVFEQLYTVWPEPLRREAERATVAERRRQAFARYGLSEDPRGARRTALQYVDAPDGGWAMNCLACHTGKVAGQIVWGAPNTLYDLQTLTEDVRAVKFKLGKPLTHLDKGSLLYPLSTTRGTTNAVVFGKLLLSFRDPDLTFHRDRLPPPLMHHDVDAVPWWHYKRKTRLYVDNFAPRGHRALMQFLLIPRNGPEEFAAWESDYRDIEAWMLSLEPPKYPFAVDSVLAGHGKAVFDRRCAECHGRYDRPSTAEQSDWPERIVPIDELGTDPVRLHALTAVDRRRYETSWFTEFGVQKVVAQPAGYLAPPLDGVWASAPYLHNGSVPTLWDLLNVEQRPVVWRRSDDGYDQNSVGLKVERLGEIPAATAMDVSERRRYFDTRQAGKSAAGHDYPEALSETEKRSVLEYLKTL